MITILLKKILEQLKLLKSNIQNISTSFNYSETEHIIGKWIDGSDLYEKTIKFISPESTNYTSLPLNIDSFNYLSIYESSLISSYQVATFCGRYNGAPVNDEWQGFINITTKSFDYRVGSSYYNCRGYITIRYTKDV